MSSSRPARGRAARPRLLLLLLAALSLLSSVAFVLAPVERPEAVYSWPSEAGDATAVAIPLMLERPTSVRAEVDCAAARAAGDGTVLLATTPLDQRPGGASLPGGLRIAVVRGELAVSTDGTNLPPQQIPASGDCAFELTSSASATTLRLDGEVVADRASDVRPAVAGVFTEVEDPDGLAVAVTADTVFQTSPTPLKIALAVLAVLALAGALVLVTRRERAPAGSTPAAPPPATPDTSDAPPGRGIARLVVDAVVVVVLGVWTVIGPMTVDDGYIAGIIRSRDENGYVGNVYRWFNAPEAPFGWFYEVLDLWSGISQSTLWMRIPSSLLGIATWLLIARGLLPRLGSFAGSRWAYAVAAAAFALWWLPTNLGLRPEPWVAAGLAAVTVLVERALRRGRLTPVLLALVVAGATLAVTPTGAVAFVPLLAAAVPILRLARTSPIGLPVLTVTAAAAVGTALLVAFADQSLAAVAEASRIRSVLPGALPWSAEPERWYLLLSNGDLQGSLSRRVPVLLTVVAVIAVLWQRLSGRWPDTADHAVAGRLMTSFGLSLVVLVATPTKWTMHFGALVPIGTALILMALHLFGTVQPAGASSSAGRVSTAALARTAAATVVVLMVGAQSWARPQPVGLPVRPRRALERRPAPGVRPQLLLDVPHPGRARGRRRGRDRDLGAVRGPRGRAASRWRGSCRRPASWRSGSSCSPSPCSWAASSWRPASSAAATHWAPTRRPRWVGSRAGWRRSCGWRPTPPRACSRPRPGSPAPPCSTGSSRCPTAERRPGRTSRWPAPGCPGGPPPATAARTARVRPAW